MQQDRIPVGHRENPLPGAAEPSEVHALVNALLRGALGARARSREASEKREDASAPGHLAVDVYLSERSDGDAAYTVLAELPGALAEDIELVVDADKLFLRVAPRSADYSLLGRQIMGERQLGKGLQRALKFDSPLDAERCTANLENGVLRVTIFKQRASRGRRVPVA